MFKTSASPSLDFQVLFEEAPSLCLVFKPDMTLVAVSKAYLRATMTRREDILGQNLFKIFPDNPDDPAATGERNLRASCERVLKNKTPDTMAVQKYDIRKPEEEGGGFEERYWSVVNSPILDRTGKVILIIHRVEDVTEFVKLKREKAAQDIASGKTPTEKMDAEVYLRAQEIQETSRQLEAERQRLMEELHQSQKMEAIGNLTGGMAHDFNNLLGIIIGNIDILQDKVQDKECASLARSALDAALRGADLTRRLLAFARQQPLQPQRIEMNKLVEGITTLLGRTLGENIEISLKLSADVWPVVADPAQLEAALTNLATNARDAMPNGGRLLIATHNSILDTDYASAHPDVVAGEYAEIEVSDNGTGMPPEIVTRIFEPFFTTKERGKGTGLGLAMVFGFMKQSGGHINIYSEVGVGTTFRLYLPRATGKDATTAEPAPAAPLAQGGHETVLVVEDNAALRTVAVRQLNELGYEVLEAENAAAALVLLADKKVDLLFSDIVMPGGLSGVDLAETAATRWPSLKVVLTSGFPDAKLNDKKPPHSLRLLSKPYRKSELARLLREALDGSPAA